MVVVTVGMPLLNWGIHKGYCEFVNKPEKLKSDYNGGPLLVEKQAPIGMTKTSTAGITYISPYFKNVNDLVLGIIGTDVYVDKKTCSNISDYLIVSFVGTIGVSAMVSFVILTFLYVYMSAKICKEQWFEKMVNVFGQCIGNACGIAYSCDSNRPRTYSAAQRNNDFVRNWPFVYEYSQKNFLMQEELLTC